MPIWVWEETGREIENPPSNPFTMPNEAMGYANQLHDVSENIDVYNLPLLPARVKSIAEMTYRAFIHITNALKVALVTPYSPTWGGGEQPEPLDIAALIERVDALEALADTPHSTLAEIFGEAEDDVEKWAVRFNAVFHETMENLK